MDRVDYQSLVIQDLVNLSAKEELNLTPWYQRRSVWNNGQKSYLINTLFEKKPIPALYFRHSLDLDKGISIREVVDGQQRSRTIIEYCNDEFSARHPEHNIRVKFSDLNKLQKSSFLLTSLPIGFLLGATDSDVVDIFARINSVAKTLNAQEKRNALYSGEFKQLSVMEATSKLEFWKSYKIFSANNIARMDEVQFVSDIIINLDGKLSAYSASSLDKYYKLYDDDFANRDIIATKMNRIFDTIAKLTPSCISETIFNRPPIFFSFIIALDAIQGHNVKKIEKGLLEIESRFNSDKPLSDRSKEDINFYNACSASTQSLANRTIRNAYIKSFIE